MRRSFSFSILLAVAVDLAGAGCKPAVKPGLVATVSIRGGGKPGERVTGIAIVFDRPVGSKSSPAAATTPFAIRPAVAGTTRWLDDRTLMFVPSAPLPRSSRFEVTVPAGTKAADGTGLVAAVVHTFETERLQVVVSLPRSSGAPDPERWAVPQQPVGVAFNQPVLTDAVAAHCSYCSGDNVTRAKLVRAEDGQGEGGPAAPHERFLVTPVQPLALATKWAFRCDQELTGAEGPLRLTSREADADPASARSEIAFETYGPFKLVEVTPSGREVDPDHESLEIRLSNPIRRDDVTIAITPTFEGAAERAYLYGNVLNVPLRRLQPNTEYRVAVGAGIKDVFAQGLPQPLEIVFRTGSAEPRLDLQTGSWVVEAARGHFTLWARNLSVLEVKAPQLTEANLLKLLPALQWWDDGAADLGALGIKSVARNVPIKGRPNLWDQAPLEPKSFFGERAGGTGLYYFAVAAPEIPRGKGAEAPSVKEVLVNVTDLGVTAKVAAGSGLVWVTRLSDGAPVAGADLVIRNRAGKMKWRGKTGADGTATTPGRAQLLPPAVGTAGTDGAEEGERGWEEGEGEDGAGRGTSLLVFARLGSDITFVDPDRYGGFEGWNFSVPVQDAQHPEQLRGFAHTDRGLYRPGDTVHLRGLVRTMRLGQGLALPGRRRVDIAVRDPRGETLVTTTVALSRFGGFNLDVPLPADARLGDNLTAFRLMAVAADAGQRFGSGDRRFTVRKPLQLLGALPRFLAVGDEAKGGVLVINDTGSAGTVTVEARVSGARLVGPGNRTVTLAAAGRAAVLFPVVAAQPGQARFRFTATLAGEKDGLDVKLPIQYPTTTETLLVAAGDTAGTADIPIALPPTTSRPDSRP